MTKQEARRRFGLKDTDVIYEPGVKSLIRSAEKLLSVWSINKYDREKLLKDIEAYKALLG